MNNDTQQVPNPAPAPQQAYASQPPKKSRLWLWITLSAVLVLLVIATILFFVFKGAADKAADEYTNKVSAYVGSVQSVIEDNTITPSKISGAVEALDAPKLEDVFLSGVSGKYTDAKKLADESTKKATDAVKAVEEYANFETFYSDWKELDAEMIRMSRQTISASNAQSVLESFHVKIKDSERLVKNAKLPTELSEPQEAINERLAAASEAWGKMVDAYKMKDSATYQAELAKYNSAVSSLSRTFAPLTTYSNSIPTKVRDAAKVLEDYKTQL